MKVKKSPPSDTPAVPLRAPQAKLRKMGFALITVLGMMTLFLILVLAFAKLSRTELASASHYSDGLRARQMSDTALSIVLSQIRQGTEQKPAGGTEIWASQPGAIRSYRENGQFAVGYKLYSDDLMVVADEAALAGDRPPADWDAADKTQHFVDLNQPIVRSDAVHFPIVDPRAIEEKVEGFSIDADAINGIVASGDPDDYRLPMPVRWLYVLEDGTVGHLDESSGKFVGANAATKGNPIVGRIAFWTDDESSKININTASDPTPWDSPRAVTKADLDYARFVPARHEFQRYPGHPASTALTPVLFPGGVADPAVPMGEGIGVLGDPEGGGRRHRRWHPQGGRQRDSRARRRSPVRHRR